MNPAMVLIGAIVAAEELGEPNAEAIADMAKGLLAGVPQAELVGMISILAKRFVQAMRASNEMLVLILESEFKVPPELARKANFPTLAGSLAGLELPCVDEDKCCKTCAFVQGSGPNQCFSTVLDATGCIESGDPFLCHQGDRTKNCRGIAQARSAVLERKQ